jgi:SAM-dependent methyltransferase
VTRQSYDLIAEQYQARNTGSRPEFVAWRDAWVAALHARAAASAASATPGASAVPVVATGAPTVLDAGAGPGQHTAALADSGLRAVALDASEAMAALARARGVPVVRGDLRRLPFADGAFDGVWASASLLHVPRDEVPATLAEWRRVAAPGGLLALSTASGGTDGWEDPPYDTGGERPPRRWFTYHDEEPLRGLLDAAGWAVEDVTTFASHRLWLRVLATARG